MNRPTEEETEYVHVDGRGALVSRVQIAKGPRHDRVFVWSRGGLTSSLGMVVDAGDGEAIAELLLPVSSRLAADKLADSIPSHRATAAAPTTQEQRNALVEAEAQRLMAGRCPDDCAHCYAAAEKAIPQPTAPR